MGTIKVYHARSRLSTLFLKKITFIFNFFLFVLLREQ
nr:MAG TPA: hypothetical protein [Caudoviricetes sp.]